MEVPLLRGCHRTARWAALSAAAAAAVAGCEYVPVAPSVERIDITAPRLSVAVGDSVQMRAAVHLAGGQTSGAAKVVVAWVSGAPTVARANPTTGVVVGVAPGRAVIRAVARDRTDSVTVTVAAP